MLGRPLRRQGSGAAVIALVTALATACAKFTAEEPATALEGGAPDGGASDGGASDGNATDAPAPALVCAADQFCDGFERLEPAIAPWIGSARGTAVSVATVEPGFGERGRTFLVAVETNAKPDFDSAFIERTLTQPKLLTTSSFELRFALKAKVSPANQVNVVEVDFTIPGTQNVVTVVVAVRPQTLALASISNYKDDYSEVPFTIDISAWRTYRLVVDSTKISLFAGDQSVVSPFGAKVVELPKIVRIGASYTDSQPSRGEVLVDDIVMPR